MNLKNNYQNFLGQLFRLLPSFRGKKKIARIFFSHNYIISPNKIIGDYKLKYAVPNFFDSIGFQLLVDGIYERYTVEFLIKCLPKDAIFIDVGSNIGTICLPLAQNRKDVSVYAIEASSNIFNYLLMNVQSNGLDNIKAFQIALSDQYSDSISFYAPSDKFGKGSFAPVFTSKSETVVSKTLDFFINEHSIPFVNLIKIDVEGFESLAFKGGVHLLMQNNAPDILFEFVDWAESHSNIADPGDAQRILRSYGYKIYRLDNLGRLVLQKETMTSGAAMLFATKKTNPIVKYI